jgi:ligand-binding sensor domain-containing protein
VQPAPATPDASPTPAPEPTVALGNIQRISEGGFAFRPLLESVVEIAGAAVHMNAINGTGQDDVAFLLKAGPKNSFVRNTSGDALSLFRQYVDAYTQEMDFEPGEPYTMPVAGLSGYAVDLNNASPGNNVSGRMIMAQPDDDRLFVLVGTAPSEVWQASIEEWFEVVRQTIIFFPPASAYTPTATPASQRESEKPATRSETRTAGADGATQTNWHVYSNANIANDVSASINTIWVATDGGAVAWNRSNDVFTKYTTRDGLAANRLTAVANCPIRGLGVVFGSEMGLQIFEAQTDSWKTLSSANSAMSFDDVAALYCDPTNGFLVVGYQQHGLDIFDVSTGEWQYLGQNEGLQNNLVEAIAVAGNRDAVWVSSGLGLSVVERDGTSAFYDDRNSPLETNQIKRIAVDEEGVVWLGGQDGLYRVLGDDWTFYDQRFVLASDFPTGAITGLVLAKDGALWLGSEAGEICHFDPIKVQCQEFYANEDGMVGGVLTSLAIGSNGAIYYTSAGGGVSMFDGVQWRAYTIPDEPLIGNQIRSMVQSSDGTIWIATEAGIQQSDPTTGAVAQQFTRAERTLASSVREVLHAAPDNGVWLGALGASYFNGVSWRSYNVPDGLAGSLVQAVATDSQGRTWFGTEAGLSIWNGSSFFNLKRENGLPSDDITALLADGDIMWISASGGGLFRFEKNQLQLINRENSELPTDSFTTMARADDGALLLGYAGGMVRLQNNVVTPVRELMGHAVTTIAPAANGAIWVGANGDGVFFFDGETWQQRLDIRPPSPYITDILVDKEGVVWIGGRHGGLLRYEEN